MVEATTRPIGDTRDIFSSLLYHTCLVGLLLGVSATVFFIASLGGYLNNPLLKLATAASVIFAALFFGWVFFTSIPKPGVNTLGFAVWLVVLGILIMEVLLSQVPPVARDELIHHLAIPRQYAQMGRIFEIPSAPYAYYPMLLEMLYIPWVQWGLDSVPKLIHGLFGFLTGFLLYAYLARRLSPLYGLLGFLIFISTPAILRLANLAYVDLGITFYTTATLLCLLQWKEKPENFWWLGMGGLMAGFILATKANGLLVFFLLGLILTFSVGRDQRLSPAAKVSSSLLFYCLALVPFLPWAVKNLVQTGNPFFPLLEGLFAFGGTGGNSTQGAQSLGLFGRRSFLYGESWWEIVSLPLRVFFLGKDNDPQHFDGVLNPILVLFLPWAFKGKWSGEKATFFFFAILYLLYACFLVEMRIRYILPIVPPLVLLAIYAIHNIYLRIARPVFLWAVVILLLSWNGIYLWHYTQKVSPFAVVWGTESRESYLTRKLVEYPVVRYINENLSRQARIYFIFIGKRVYYCNCNYFHDEGDSPWLLLQMIQRADNPGGVLRELQERKLTHLFIRLDLLERFLRNNLSPQKQGLWNAFATEFLQEQYRTRNYGVYKING